MADIKIEARDVEVQQNYRSMGGEECSGCGARDVWHRNIADCLHWLREQIEAPIVREKPEPQK